MDFVTRLDLASNDAPLEAKRLREALETACVVPMRPSVDTGDLRSFYDTLVEHLGTPDRIGEDYAAGGHKTGERWLEIRYDPDIPDMAAFRHSKNAQPVHTDESYVSDPADIMVFYCVNNAPVGGATVFLPGPPLVEKLRRDARELYERLTTEPVRYEKAGDYRHEPIIGFDDNGRPTFNYNYYCVNEPPESSACELNQDFFDFLKQEHESGDLAERVRLQPGEAVAWWDKHVLHGRDSFEATHANERFIWKAGVRW